MFVWRSLPFVCLWRWGSVALIAWLFMSQSGLTQTPLKAGDSVLVYLRTSQNIPYGGRVGRFENDRLSVISRGDFRIDQAVTKDSIKYDFAGVGASFDAEQSILSGNAGDGSELAIPLSEVAYVRMSVFSPNGVTSEHVGARDLSNRLSSAGTSSVRLWEGSVDSIHYVRVYHEGNTKAIIICGLVGLSAGLTYGVLKAKDDEAETSSFSEGYSFDPFKFNRSTKIVLLSLAGASVGFIIGSVAFGERNEAVLPHQLKLAVGPGLSGGYRLSVAYNL